VTAPVNGIAGIRVANIGDLVGTSERSVLTSVSQLDPIFVEFPVSEQEYLGLRSFLLQGDPAQQASLDLILADGSTYPHHGTIDIVGREVNPTTGTLRIRGLFPNPGNILRPGQYAKIRAATSVKKGAILLPQEAVEEVQGAYQVIVVGPSNRCEVRAVSVGDRIGSYWLIENGLRPTERVVVGGLQDVRSGDEVNPKPAKLPPLKAQ
jgi:membrane fusion protein, multidrug efflux system